MEDVSSDLLEEFKERMHISHSSEDDNLKRLLSFSISAINSSCGVFDINGEKDTDQRAKELVFERTRYAYNDALEYFDDNFLSQITSLGLSLIPESDVDATI
ncbi:MULTISPECIES: phage gp6-like head-tail connector protein [unclassified Bacillus (in: firmicutes)]|uniref:phage gp6-like head-tail connector protein n=1 Tax=unclassified Bacillus (in: firmicutes) TaxID=185979 RepID=UPI001BE74BBD|nr:MULTISPECIES: phage gp6-like head-tail connector protein [unclassified Bacillus (in: firmicutes)]MBT2615326.1 phage gp6-like head-tail connector protein [Bacillus sp. ISL-78]MBT2628060.1 phage gp6-like head-tail connector protein [Bacillus sp. ISL-101]MBT2717977.1 phage gp6-like head-tail connector protein [Bacillus sp. ISL-57]